LAQAGWSKLLCGARHLRVAAAVANAVYHATGVRVRDYAITLDKLMAQMPQGA
jgi:CO/xanthine dehydrogenase Mo-binding subunit